jgi:hypothetical protein
MYVSTEFGIARPGLFSISLFIARLSNGNAGRPQARLLLQALTLGRSQFSSPGQHTSDYNPARVTTSVMQGLEGAGVAQPLEATTGCAATR